MVLQFLDFSTILSGFYKSLDQRGKPEESTFTQVPGTF
jgi:hypothetical protein